ncbi:MAG: methylmalonyl Co-A mutase-associated GTPase MeaB, partial [Acidimicrobiia bacterium]|nr:methylmalonyl Co-A mutase-associated GTPase MeaB [Acidimicrobiia bacterium]
MTLRDLSVEDLVDRARSGDRRALGRVLSWIEAGGARADEVTAVTHPLAGDSHVVGITGSPGAGKSTLTGQLVHVLC